MSNLSLERLLFDAANPADGPLIGSYLLGAGGTVISETGTYLDVNIASVTGMGIYAEDSAAASGDLGQASLLVREDTLAISTSTDGDYGNFKSTSKGELYTHDADAKALLGTIDADTGAILSDTNAMVVDLAAIEVLITSGNALLTTIDADTGNIATSTGSIDTKLTSTNALLTTIDADTSLINTNVANLDSTLTALSKAEDAAHSSGDNGVMSLGVRSDTQVSLASATGDYTPAQYESLGRLRIFDAPDSSVVSAAVTVGTTAVALPALSGRARVMIQNNGNKPLFIGGTGVVVGTGLEVAKGATLSLEAGPNVALFGISSAAGQDVRVLEVA